MGPPRENEEDSDNSDDEGVVSHDQNLFDGYEANDPDDMEVSAIELREDLFDDLSGLIGKMISFMRERDDPEVDDDDDDEDEVMVDEE
jgi:hypothetical protein